MSFSVKVTFRLGGEESMRRFAVSGWEDFLARIEKCAEVSDADSVRFLYEDDEGDTVTFDTAEGFGIAMMMPGDLHRIAVVPKDPVAPKKPSFLPFCPRFNVGCPGMKKKKCCPFLRRCGVGRCGRFGRRGCRRFGGGGRGHCGRFRFPQRLFRCANKLTNCHLGVICDGPGCTKRNWEGQRFKCTCCPNYDLCGECMTRADLETFHPADHVFEEVQLNQKKKKEQEQEDSDSNPLAALMRMFGAVGQPHQQEQEQDETLKTEAETEVETECECDSEEEGEVDDLVEEVVPAVPTEPTVIIPSEVDEEEKDTAATAADESEEEEEDPFALSLKLLLAMGFGDVVQNRDLLQKHGGNLSMVVEAILGT